MELCSYLRVQACHSYITSDQKPQEQDISVSSQIQVEWLIRFSHVTVSISSMM